MYNLVPFLSEYIKRVLKIKYLHVQFWPFLKDLYYKGGFSAKFHHYGYRGSWPLRKHENRFPWITIIGLLKQICILSVLQHRHLNNSLGSASNDPTDSPSNGLLNLFIWFLTIIELLSSTSHLVTEGSCLDLVSFTMLEILEIYATTITYEILYKRERCLMFTLPQLFSYSIKRINRRASLKLYKKVHAWMNKGNG